MEFEKINQDELIFALDIGTRSIIGTVGIVRDKKFQVISEYYVEHQERAMIDGQIHDITLVANAVNQVKKELEKDLNIKLSSVSIAAAGRFLRTTVAKAEQAIDYDKEIDKEIIRSVELTAVRKAEEEINKQAAGKLYCVGYTVKNYYLNNYVISNLLSHRGQTASAEVIATFLPRSVVESLYSVMEKVGLNVVNLTLEPIAAMEAAIPQNLRLLNLALVDIGAGTSDIAISSKDTISAYGMVSMAGDEVTEAIAQNYLIDFNTAERVKRECSIRETVMYTDVLGIENEVLSSDILKLIGPIVDKITEEISGKIVELNGGKAPNAVFLVGGGAHTPMLKEKLAEKLNLPGQRIAIKGRDSVVDCHCNDNGLGSTGVTVLGIALVTIKKSGHDFIDVVLNGNVISLFNSRKHTVMDVMMQAGINPRVLIGKNGKNVKFNLNGNRRVVFGTLAVNAEVMINGVTANMDSEVKEGDNIQIIFAKDGKDANPKVMEVIPTIESISFYLNGDMRTIEPVLFINNTKADFNDFINDGDDIKIIFPDTLADYIKYVEEDEHYYDYFISDIKVSDSYKIKDGDSIVKADAYTVKIDIDKEIAEKDVYLSDYSGDERKNSVSGAIANEDTADFQSAADHAEKPEKKDESENLPRALNSTGFKECLVIVNGDKIALKNKPKYIFIDIFDYIDFDLTRAKGSLVLTLNGAKAGYYDELSPGDNIEVYWE